MSLQIRKSLVKISKDLAKIMFLVGYADPRPCTSDRLKLPVMARVDQTLPCLPIRLGH
jgi:hypothetical protein